MMKKTPNLSPNERLWFWILQLILLVIPFYPLISKIIIAPALLIQLIENNLKTPLGWMLLLMVCLFYGIIIFLFFNSIKRIESRPIYKSIIITIILLGFDMISFLVLFFAQAFPIFVSPVGNVLIKLFLEAVFHR